MSKFVWHDLMTKDVDGAKGFYGELFGWQLKKEQQGPYTLIYVGNEHIGGALPLHQPNLPPHWIGYISTTNVDETAEKIGKHGGKIVAPKQSIPNVGTFVVAADPTGGYFIAYQDAKARADSPIPEKPPVGTFCWNELMSTDPAAAEKFFQQVFGWTSESMEMGSGMGTYTLFKHPSQKQSLAGMMKVPQPGMPSSWLHYVAVADADATAAKVTKLGGKMLMPVHEVKDVGRFAPAQDPQGAVFAILGPNK